MGKEISGKPLVRAHPRAGLVIVLMLLASLGFFGAGIFCPFTSITKLWLFENQISVFRGLLILWHAGELFLFLILFVFPAPLKSLMWVLPVLLVLTMALVLFCLFAWRKRVWHFVHRLHYTLLAVALRLFLYIFHSRHLLFIG